MLLLVPQVPLHTGEHKINFKEIRPIKFNLIAIFNTVSAEHERKKEEKKRAENFLGEKSYSLMLAATNFQPIGFY